MIKKVSFNKQMKLYYININKYLNKIKIKIFEIFYSVRNFFYQFFSISLKFYLESKDSFLKIFLKLIF